MSNKKKMSKEYAVLVSLTIFFFIITIVGSIRLIKKSKKNDFDLSNIGVVEQDTNIDWNYINLKVASAINNKYGIDVYYGDNLNLTSVNAVPITNETKIFEMLKQITSALSNYPDGLIREIEKKGYSVSIYLVDHFNNGIEALANRNTIGQFKIYMSNTTNITRAMHHECFHILDYYIKLEADERMSYKDWYMFNPDEFEYINNVNAITAEYVYSGSKGAYFVTPYAKFSEKEDRAETFAEMLTASKSEIFFEQDESIKGKMDIISNVLKSTFFTVYSWNYLT